MGDFFYSCLDCPEHSEVLNHKTGDLQDHCDLKDRNFTKTFPMRDTPCKEMFTLAEYECPECDEVMAMMWKNKRPHFICSKHGEQEIKDE